MDLSEFREHITHFSGDIIVGGLHFTVEYSDHIGYEYYAIVNDVLVDVSDYEYVDHDGFIDAALEEFQKTQGINEKIL